MGIYGLIKIILPIFTPLQTTIQTILTLMAVLSMFSGNLMALRQTDLKRLLAYSSIVNIGYILIGLSLGTTSGLIGSIFHVFNHALIKGLLFMIAGAFLYASGTRDLNLLIGIGRKMQVSGTLFTIAALAIIGVPSLNGFLSKLYIISACIETDAYILVAVILINFIISTAYFLRTIYQVMYRNPKITNFKEVPMTMLVPMIILTVSCVIIGVFPQPFIALIENVASTILLI
jgi:formate hydrogenlyase subunit 3/multisubunit Na+/H+ antiporter MnhD subunit